MTPDEQSATYAARHAHHLAAMLGEAAAEAIDSRAKIDTLAAACADLEKQVAEANRLRDEALHMQAETFKTVEQNGETIQRLTAQCESHIEMLAAAQRELASRPPAPRRVKSPHPDPKNPRV